jgi:hypothetical protein
MKVALFWDVMPRIVAVTNVSEVSGTSIFRV